MSGEENGGAFNQSPPGGEVGLLTEEKARQTEETLTYS